MTIHKVEGFSVEFKTDLKDLSKLKKGITYTGLADTQVQFEAAILKPDAFTAEVHFVLRCDMPVFQPPHTTNDEFRILAKGVWAGRIIKLDYCFMAGPHASSCSNAQVCSSRRARVNCARAQAAAHLVVRIFEEGMDGQLVLSSTGFFNESCQCYSGSEDST